MFTGIIETQAILTKIVPHQTNISLWFESEITNELSIDQSISHNGICLTVEEIIDNQYKVTAISETIQKTTISNWALFDRINLERCLKANGRFDGHFVSGHIDSIAICTNIIDQKGSWEFQFEIQPQFAHLIIEKGSIAINGISLTVFDVGNNCFKVAIIPYTYAHTSIQFLQPNNKVNIEFDIIGKYINRKSQLNFS